MILAAVVLIVLHNVDGGEVTINPEHVVVLQPTKDENLGTPQRLMAPGPKCVIGLSNGKFVSVVEDCGLIRQAIREATK